MNKEYSFKFQDRNYSFLPFIIFAISIIGFYVYAVSNVQGGMIYFILTGSGTIALFLLFIFVKESDRNNKLLVPFHYKATTSAVYYVLGIMLAVILLGTLSFVSTQSASFVMSVLHPFATATPTASPGSNIPLTFADDTNTFITSYEAGSIEELIVRFFAVLIFFPISVFALYYCFKYKGIFWNFIVGVFLLPSLGFLALHFTNKTYVNQPVLFLYAGLFALLMTFFVYVMRWGIEFAVGFHQTVNAFALGAVFLSGMFSIIGIIIFIPLVISLIIIFSNRKEVLKVFTEMFSNISFSIGGR